MSSHTLALRTTIVNTTRSSVNYHKSQIQEQKVVSQGNGNGGRAQYQIGKLNSMTYIYNNKKALKHRSICPYFH
jgi:hypothetical protein